MRTRNSGRALAACLAILIAACLGCTGKKEEVKGEGAAGLPKIAAAERSFDFGKVRQGQDVEHLFAIRNRGNGDLVIERATGSRGCKATVVTTTAIPPGGEGKIKASLSTKGLTGKVTRKVLVTSNDKLKPRMALTMKGEVFGDVTVSPRAVSFGQLGKSEKAVRELSITVEEPDKIKVTSVTSEDPRFTVALKEGTAEGTAKYEVAFNGSDKIERIAGKIVIKYEGSNVPAVFVPYNVSVTGNLRYPKSLYFGKREGAFQPKEIVFNSRNGKDIGIRRVEDPDKKLDTKIKTPKGPNVVVTAEVADPNASYATQEQHILKVYTTDTDEPVAEISYMISDQERSPRGMRPPVSPSASGATKAMGAVGAASQGAPPVRSGGE